MISFTDAYMIHLHLMNQARDAMHEYSRIATMLLSVNDYN